LLDYSGAVIRSGLWREASRVTTRAFWKLTDADSGELAWLAFTRPEAVLTLDQVDRHTVATVLGKSTAQALKARR
jgi:hypothetical protein